MPDVSDVHRNGPTMSERPYASVVAFVGPLPRQSTPLHRSSPPLVCSSTCRAGFQVWQYALVPCGLPAETWHSMLPLGEWNHRTVAPAAGAETSAAAASRTLRRAVRAPR